MSAQNQYIDSKGHMAESTMRIKDLAQAEKVIGKTLVQHACTNFYFYFRNLFY